MKDQKAKKSKSGGFQSLGLSKPIFKGVMRMGYKVPTPIQRSVLPVALSGKDVMAMARTGSGKTCAFLLPLLEKLGEHSTQAGVDARGVILSPTRELAIQTLKFARSMSHFTDLRCSLIVGGDSMEVQFASLASCPDIIVATPGRLVHHLDEVSDFSLKSVEIVVFDEADRIFEMGFAEQLLHITKEMPEERQTMLFSATLPASVVQFARAGMTAPQIIRLDTDVKVSEQLKMSFVTCQTSERLAVFMYIMRELIPRAQQTIVFAATRHHVEYLTVLLRHAHFDAVCVYGQMDQEARTMSMSHFRSKKAHVLVVTDVAARGIDIPMLDNVVNFHFPAAPNLFTHRVGRAARAGRSGVAISLAAPDELGYMMELQMHLGRTLVPGTSYWDNHDVPLLLEKLAVDEVHYGGLPRELLDFENEGLLTLMENNEELASLEKVCRRAYKQYIKSRGEPSRRSLQRAKEVTTQCFVGVCLHPLFAKSRPEGEGSGGAAASGPTIVSRDALVARIRGFRPCQTILEIKSKGSNKLGDAENNPAEAMRHKRRVHQALISQTQAMTQLDESGSASFAAAPGEESEAGASDSGGGSGHERPSGSDDDEATASSSAVPPAAPRAAAQLRPQAKPAPQKRRVSQAERRQMKRRRAAGGVAEPSSLRAAGDDEKRAAKKPKAESFRSSGGWVSNGLTGERQLTEDTATAEATGEHKKSFQERLIEEAMMDIQPDETMAMQDKKRIQRWDAKKKKFVQSTVGEVRRGEVREKRENGGIKRMTKKEQLAQRGQLYQKWQQKTHKRIGNSGEEESTPTVVANKVDMRGGRARHHLTGFGYAETAAPSRIVENAAVENELKSHDAIVKDQREKAFEQEKLKGKHADSSKLRDLKKKKKTGLRGKGNIKGKYHGAKGNSLMIIRKGGKK